MAGVGVLLCVIGALMPWATALGGALSKTGIEGDGLITLIAALAVGGLMLSWVYGAQSRTKLVIAVLLALGITGIAVIDAIDVVERELTIGSGLYATLIGGLISVVGCIVALNESGRESPQTHLTTPGRPNPRPKTTVSSKGSRLLETMKSQRRKEELRRRQRPQGQGDKEPARPRPMLKSERRRQELREKNRDP